MCRHLKGILILYDICSVICPLHDIRLISSPLAGLIVKWMPHVLMPSYSRLGEGSVEGSDFLSVHQCS